MAVVVVWQDPITGKNGFTALSTDTLPNAAAGSQAWITDQPGTIKQYDGTAWVQTRSGGAALVNANGPAGVIESQIITIDGLDDVMTNSSAPVVGELIKIVPASSDKQRCMVRWLHTDGSRVPYAEGVVASLNCTEDNIALTRLTVANNGAGGTNVASYTANKLVQSVSGNSPMARWDLTQGDTVITDLYLGAIPTNDADVLAGTNPGAAIRIEVLFY